MAWIPALVLLPAAVAAADVDLPVEIRTAKGVRYYNGGVGIDERKQLPQIFPLKIVLATDKGLYLNDAEVRVIDAAGEEVFRAQADDGPWLVADLPPGTYSVEATLEGRSAKARSIRVRKGGRQVVILRWKSSLVDMGLSAAAR